MDKEAIKAKIEVDDKWLFRGILAIYEKQTMDEKNSKVTCHENGVGFNGTDAEILSSFAEGIKKYGSLTQKQIPIARKKMIKYAGQLARIAKEKAAKAA